MNGMALIDVAPKVDRTVLLAKLISSSRDSIEIERSVYIDRIYQRSNLRVNTRKHAQTNGSV